MTLVGCDLHTRKQQVAALDTATGETYERQLLHEGSAVEEFYAALPRSVTVGIESTGYAIWFHAWSASGIPCSLVPGRCSYAFFAKLRRVP